LILPKKYSVLALKMSEPKGLSILIPIYNYDARRLVLELLEQAFKLNLPFEIRCYDDGSSADIKKINEELSSSDKITYIELPENIGRSAIRNKLASEALYPDLLFLDCDSGIVRKDFLKKYIEFSQKEKIIIGGTVYQQEPDKTHSLRWKYGKAREERSASKRSLQPFDSITMNNMFISKDIYLGNKLDESIRTYGHEDTKFGNILRQKNIRVLHIDNPVQHCGLEENQVFIDKTREGIKNYYKLIKEGYAGNSRIHKAYNIVRHFPLRNIFMVGYKMMNSNIRKNLLSENPSLLYFDLFKLKMLIEEESE
jgi:glycosyltransferase involved in cell wall biosynthesis